MVLRRTKYMLLYRLRVCIFFENFGRPIKPKSNAMKYEDKALYSGLKNGKNSAINKVCIKG